MFRYDNVPMEINRLRCRVNYHALKFLPDIEEMADKLAARMRNRTGNINPYMYVINYISFLLDDIVYSLYLSKTLSDAVEVDTLQVLFHNQILTFFS